MDDALKPKWGDVDFDDRFARNLFHCIDDGGDVQVEIISSDFASEKDYESLLKHSDDQAHFKLTEVADKFVVSVKWIEREKNEKKVVQFQISEDLFDMIKGFHCVQSDKRANIDMDALMREMKREAYLKDYGIDIDVLCSPPLFG
ncbi:hypothetical protein QTG54_015467 [Skeletonema marinoi]|uniref:Uncharacterized protein n=1 Tax=Skeletonema marinoi TaxID=267567 RepID=A0AAD8XUX3_9STRA|nr:hypothetical protein QTG54_015467 [Skeletonema marinoi]